MRVPASDEVQIAGEHLVDLASLSCFIGPVRIAPATIRTAWAGDRTDVNRWQRKAGEQQPSGLPLPETRLAMPVKVGEHGVAERQRLPGSPTSKEITLQVPARRVPSPFR